MKLEAVPNGPDWLKRCPKTGSYYVSKYRADLPAPRLERKIRNPQNLDEKLTFTQARKIGEDMIAKWISGHLEQKRKKITVEIAAAELLEYRKKRFEGGKIRIGTWNHDRVWIPLLKKWFGSIDLKEFDETYWETWFDETGSLMKRSHSDTAKYLSILLNFAFTRKWIARKPTIRNLDQHAYKGRIYTTTEIDSLRQNADDRLKEQIIFGYEMGMRTHEVRELQWTMVKIELETVLISLPAWFTKTGESREFHASPNAAKALRIRHAQKTGTFVWPSNESPDKSESDSSFYIRFRAAVERAGIVGRIRFYDLRHTFFNRLVYEMGMSRELVAEYGGNSPETLKRNYLDKKASNTSAIATKISLEDCGNIPEQPKKPVAND